jgi:hypothetical protein
MWDCIRYGAIAWSILFCACRLGVLLLAIGRKTTLVWDIRPWKFTYPLHTVIWAYRWPVHLQFQCWQRIFLLKVQVFTTRVSFSHSDGTKVNKFLQHQKRTWQSNIFSNLAQNSQNYDQSVQERLQVRLLKEWRLKQL